MTDEIAGKIVEAYKLTGLLLFNVCLFLGMGYYIVKVQQSAGVFVSEMQREMLELAKTCSK